MSRVGRGLTTKSIAARAASLTQSSGCVRSKKVRISAVLAGTISRGVPSSEPMIAPSAK